MSSIGSSGRSTATDAFSTWRHGRAAGFSYAKTLGLRGTQEVEHLSWSVTQRSATHDPVCADAFDELVVSCRDMCVRQFPDDHGYQLTRQTLSGPVDGTRFLVTRGRLRVLLSVQKFERAHRAPVPDSRALEVRIVSSLAVITPNTAAPRHRSVAVWSVASCALGTFGLSALALTTAGIFTAAMQATMLIPALIVWRTCATIGIAREMRRQAELGSTHAVVTQHAITDALPRWRRLATGLELERERIAERLGRRKSPWRAAPLASRPSHIRGHRARA